jgi:hypothetical protein
MSDSAAGSWLAVYGPWLIGGIAGLVAFFITAAIMNEAKAAFRASWDRWRAWAARAGLDPT